MPMTQPAKLSTRYQPLIAISTRYQPFIALSYRRAAIAGVFRPPSSWYVLALILIARASCRMTASFPACSSIFIEFCQTTRALSEYFRRRNIYRTTAVYEHMYVSSKLAVILYKARAIKIKVSTYQEGGRKTPAIAARPEGRRGYNLLRIELESKK